MAQNHHLLACFAFDHKRFKVPFATLAGVKVAIAASGTKASGKWRVALVNYTPFTFFGLNL